MPFKLFGKKVKLPGRETLADATKPLPVLDPKISRHERMETRAKIDDGAPTRTVLRGAKTIGTFALGSLVIGIAYGLFSHLVNKVAYPWYDLDPPAPWMNEHANEIANMFNSLMKEYYELCPDAKKAKYVKHLRSAIGCAELVAKIEGSFKVGKFSALSLEDIQAMASHAQKAAKICMQELKSVEILYDSHTMHLFSNIASVINVFLIDHVVIIDTLKQHARETRL